MTDIQGQVKTFYFGEQIQKALYLSALLQLRTLFRAFCMQISRICPTVVQVHTVGINHSSIISLYLPGEYKINLVK